MLSGLEFKWLKVFFRLPLMIWGNLPFMISTNQIVLYVGVLDRLKHVCPIT